MPQDIQTHRPAELRVFSPGGMQPGFIIGWFTHTVEVFILIYRFRFHEFVDRLHSTENSMYKTIGPHLSIALKEYVKQMQAVPSGLEHPVYIFYYTVKIFPIFGCMLKSWNGEDKIERTIRQLWVEITHVVLY